MIYLIGVTHDLQCYNDDNANAISFYGEIKKICIDNKVNVIIEEFNEDSINENNCSNSTLRKLANNIDIDHIFCDPGRESRNKLGIKDVTQIKTDGFFNNNSEDEINEQIENQFEIRECLWIDIIMQSDPNNNDIIFVCGNDHIENMMQKFDSEGFDYEYIDITD